MVICSERRARRRVTLLLLLTLTIVLGTASAQVLDPARAQVGIKQYQRGLGSVPLRESYAVTLGQSWLAGARIFGGAPVPKGTHPWQVALLHSWTASNLKAQFCGGAYVGPRYVVTAAHCVGQGTQKEQVDVFMGSTDLTSGEHRFAVDAIIIERGYQPHAGNMDNPKNFDHDIALLKVTITAAQIAGLGHSLERIELVTAQQEARYLMPSQEVAVSGWGRTEEGESVVAQLREVLLPVVAYDDCNDVSGYNHELTASMMCAGRYSGGADTCTGDSGGPLTITVAGSSLIGGVTSFGAQGHCGDAGYYGVYTRISLFRDWIEKLIGP